MLNKVIKKKIYNNNDNNNETILAVTATSVVLLIRGIKGEALGACPWGSHAHGDKQ